jgi:hypothetical protein
MLPAAGHPDQQSGESSSMLTLVECLYTAWKASTMGKHWLCSSSALGELVSSSWHTGKWVDSQLVTQLSAGFSASLSSVLACKQGQGTAAQQLGLVKGDPASHARCYRPGTAPVPSGGRCRRAVCPPRLACPRSVTWQHSGRRHLSPAPASLYSVVYPAASSANTKSLPDKRQSQVSRCVCCAACQVVV